MDTIKRKALEEAGWKFGDAEDFLEMSEEEKQLLNARMHLAMAIQQQRKLEKLSQKELGVIINASQHRIAKIERAASDVSMDQMIRAFTAAGGKIVFNDNVVVVTKIVKKTKKAAQTRLKR